MPRERHSLTRLSLSLKWFCAFPRFWLWSQLLFRRYAHAQDGFADASHDARKAWQTGDIVLVSRRDQPPTKATQYLAAIPFRLKPVAEAFP